MHDAAPRRRTRRLTAVAVAALAAAGVASLVAAPAARSQNAPAAAGQSGATGGKAAVVNVNLVRSKIKELNDFRAKVQAQQALIDASRKGHEAQLATATDALRNLKPETEQWNEKIVKLDEDRAKFNVEDQLAQAGLLRAVNFEQKRLYDKIIAVATQLAKRKGIDVVMVYNDVQVPPGVQEMNPEQLNTLLGQRTILYVSDQADLTNEVIAMMDSMK